MTKVLVVNDLNENKWSFAEEYQSSYHVDLFFKFNSNLIYKDLSFGFEIKKELEVIIKKSWPQGKTKYVSSNQSFLETERILLNPTELYKVECWAINDNLRTNVFFDLCLPIPKKVFDSWVWKDYKWNPPVPYPTDGKIYKWDELICQWAPSNKVND
jgi:hypothetical protein